jgi:hypothetical protein
MGTALSSLKLIRSEWGASGTLSGATNQIKLLSDNRFRGKTVPTVGTLFRYDSYISMGIRPSTAKPPSGLQSLKTPHGYRVLPLPCLITK